MAQLLASFKKTTITKVFLSPKAIPLVQSYKNKFLSIHYNNVTFTDEKLIILHNLLKLRTRKDSLTRFCSELTTLSGINTKKDTILYVLSGLF